MNSTPSNLVVPSQPKLSETRQHTPTPWEAQEFDPEDKCVPIIGLRAECPDGPTNGMVAIATLFPTEMDAIDGIGPELAIANAAFIVDAVNSHASLKSRVQELEAIARQSRDAMLRTRTASIAGCEEGYGKPEKWGDELFASHGGLTASIKAIDAVLSAGNGEVGK